MLNHRGTQEIRTERLVLRAVRADDYKDMYEYMRIEKMSRYVTWKRHENENVTKELCEMWANQYTDERYNWAITLNGKAVGNIDVIKIYENTAYMGWQISPEHWNKGMITEAANAVFDFLFSQIGIEAIEASYIKENIASGRVMQKTGMRPIPTEESIYYKLNNTCEMNGMSVSSYKLTREEWLCQNTQ